MRYSKRFIIPGVLFLTGCMVGPSYEAPNFQFPDQYRADTSFVDSSEQRSTLFWWRYYNDPVLDKLVTEGTGENLDVLTAIARVNEARAIAGEGRLGLYPESTLGGEYTEGKFGTATNPFFESSNRDFRAYRGSASLDWEIDLFGRVRRIIEQREATQSALEESLADVLLSVQAEIVETYLNLRTAEVEKQVLRANSKTQEESVAITNSQFEVGSASELDVARARSQLFRTRSEIPLVEARVQAGKSRLAVLLGRSPADLPEYLNVKPTIPKFNGPVSIVSPAELLARRPDVREAERRLIAANADIGVETAEFFPRVTLLGTVGLEARNFSDLGEKNTDFYSVGPSITWRILNVRRILRRIDAADERTMQALHTYQQTALKALEDVENALTEFKTFRSRYSRITQATNESRKAAEISRIQYKAGSLDFLDVLAADSSKLELEQLQALSEAQVQRSYVRLFRAFGGGWDVAPDSPESSGNDQPSAKS